MKGNEGGLESRRTGQLVVEQMGISIQEHYVGVTVIERIVALVIDLPFRTLSAIHGRARAQGFDGLRRLVCVSQIREKKVSRGRAVAREVILNIHARRAV